MATPTQPFNYNMSGILGKPSALNPAQPSLNFGGTPPAQTPPAQVGAKAKAPVANKTTTSLPANQTAPPISTGTKGTGSNTGAVGSANALNGADYASRVSAYANYDPSQDPAVLDAQNRQRDFENSYATTQTNIASRPNPFGYASSLSDLAGARYAELSPTYTAQVGQAQTGASQKQAGLAGAAGLTAPVQVNPGNFYVSPTTGKDITGGSISPGAGGARIGQVGLGTTGQTNIPKLNAAAGAVNDFNGTLAKSGLQGSDVNLGNFLQNLYAGNTSNPYYPQLYSSFNNAINFYAQVLGQDPNQLITTLSSTAKNTTLSQMFQNLDKEARDYNNQIVNSSFGANSTTPVQPAPQQTPPAFTRPNGQVVRLQADGTYQ